MVVGDFRIVVRVIVEVKQVVVTIVSVVIDFASADEALRLGSLVFCLVAAGGAGRQSCIVGNCRRHSKCSEDCHGGGGRRCIIGSEGLAGAATRRGDRSGGLAVVLVLMVMVVVVVAVAGNGRSRLGSVNVSGIGPPGPRCELFANRCGWTSMLGCVVVV